MSSFLRERRCLEVEEGRGSFRARCGVRRWIVEDWPVSIWGRAVVSILGGNVKADA